MRDDVLESGSPMSNEFQLADAPRLTVVERRDDGWFAQVASHRWVGQGWSCLILLDPARTAWATFVEVDATAGTARLRMDDSTVTPRIGETYAFFDGYWGERVDIVLGEPRRFGLAHFVPYEVRRGAEGAWTPDDGVTHSDVRAEIARGDPDHEHCAICSQKSGHGGDPSAHVSDRGEWVCDACYEGFVLPRSIGFVSD
jgi:hypothetical protein